MPGLDRSARKTVVGTGLLALALTSLSVPASAAEYTRTLTISKIAGVSTSRPGYPPAQSVIRVFATVTGAWGSSTCRNDSADVSMEDWHIYGIVMKAWKEQIPLQVTIESTERIDGTDTVCKIVAVNPST